MDYQDFLESKGVRVQSTGIEIELSQINPMLYEFQRDIVKWACYKGCAAIFAGTGLGKTFMYLEWARLMGQTTLIVAPLSVAYQTIREAEKLGIHLVYTSNDLCVKPGMLYITNYERLDAFRPELFDAVVLDESSRLKNMNGKQRNKLVSMFAKTTYKLCATATPAPNDINELGNHAAFLGFMTMPQYSAQFFCHEQSARQKIRAGKWRLKGHAVENFYKWLASWAVAINKPSDLGYSDEGHELPPLTIKHKTVEYIYEKPGMLPGFGGTSLSAIDLNNIRKNTIQIRNDEIAPMINASDEQWLVWCKLNDEAAELQKLIPDSFNIHGSLTPEEKAQAMIDYQDGKIRVLITKIKIAGMGMNLQNSHNMVFHGIDYSWEGYYQAIRRQWRHKQENEVFVYVVTSTHASKVFEIVLEKEREAVKMTDKLIEVTRKYTAAELRNMYAHDDETYQTGETYEDKWTMFLGDSSDRIAEIPDNSIDLTITSPPFSDMYVYNNTMRDLSNSANIDEFFAHYRYIIEGNLRITKPGRLACVHIQDLKNLKSRDGYRGLKDFSGQIIRAFIDAGWNYRATITVDKNPQVVAIRTKDHDLLFVSWRKDSAGVCPVPPDYVLLFRKPGKNEVPVTPQKNGEMTEEDWIRDAHAIWYDVKETAVLNAAQARSNADEKHMCPLQLPLIERCLKLWSNPGEMIFDPFAGIGSTGYEALKNNREFIGIELKPEYYNVACRNLKNAELMTGGDLFQWASQQETIDNG